MGRKPFLRQQSIHYHSNRKLTMYRRLVSQIVVLAVLFDIENYHQQDSKNDQDNI
jgi:hypothetical protein